MNDLDLDDNDKESVKKALETLSEAQQDLQENPNSRSAKRQLKEAQGELSNLLDSDQIKNIQRLQNAINQLNEEINNLQEEDNTENQIEYHRD